MPTIRPSRDEDLPAITAIYAHHVLHGTGTFETDPPSAADMAARRAERLAEIERQKEERKAKAEARAAALPGAAFTALALITGALSTAYDSEVLIQGQGGSIPLCNVLQSLYPDAEIMLLGVEEPSCLIHAPNESVDPSEIENLAIAEALFLRDYVRPE